ncbi:MAG: hypothetical protein JWQ14_3111, partial [Adhaeribacter sp.]|nr:hypothetical protein [Adhaeribacter sp.]
GADNIYRKFRNDSVKEEYPYRIAKEKKASPSPDSAFVFYLEKAEFGRPLFLVDADTLQIGMPTGWFNGPVEYFVRKKVTGKD